MKKEIASDHGPKMDGLVYREAAMSDGAVGELWGASCTRCHWRKAACYSNKMYAEFGVSSHLRMSHGLRLPNKPRIEEHAN